MAIDKNKNPYYLKCKQCGHIYSDVSEANLEEDMERHLILDHREAIFNQFVEVKFKEN